MRLAAPSLALDDGLPLPGCRTRNSAL